MTFKSWEEDDNYPSLATLALRAAKRLAKRGYNALMERWVRAGVNQARVPHR